MKARAKRLRARGDSCQSIAEELDVSERTVYRWVAQACKGAALQAERGRFLISDERLTELIEDLKRGPASLGLGGGPWTLTLIAQHLGYWVDLHLHESQVSRLLKRADEDIQSVRVSARWFARSGRTPAVNTPNP